MSEIARMIQAILTDIEGTTSSLSFMTCCFLMLMRRWQRSCGNMKWFRKWRGYWLKREWPLNKWMMRG